jgi:hypothetical protein
LGKGWEGLGGRKKGGGLGKGGPGEGGGLVKKKKEGRGRTNKITKRAMVTGWKMICTWDVRGVSCD